MTKKKKQRKENKVNPNQIETISSNSEYVYRLRPLNFLTGEMFQELEKQSIYFAPFHELNDPMEGKFEITWKGNSINWSYLFNYYLLCLHFYVLKASFKPSADFSTFFTDFFPLYIVESDLNEEEQQSFSISKRRFFSNNLIVDLIKYLDIRNIMISKKYISVIFIFISEIALESVLYGQNESGINQQPFLIEITKMILNQEIFKLFIEMIEQNENIPQNDLNKLFESLTQSLYESDLIMLCKFNFHGNNINWFHFCSVFVDVFVKQLPFTVFPTWYSSSFFSKFPNKMTVWSNYANNHMGVCLIFKINNNDNIKSLSLTQINESKTIRTERYTFETIFYTNKKTPKIDYFALLNKRLFYVFKNNLTPTGKGDIDKNIFTKDKLDEFNEGFKFIQTTKTKDWEYEGEVRLITDNSLYWLEDTQARTFKYNFNDLNGIVFGMNTPIKEKIKIINIIVKKCKDNGRKDFNFYQASYNENKKEIVYIKLNISEKLITSDEL